MLPIILAIINESEDSDMVGDLYEKYNDIMYRFAYSILYDAELADDALGDAAERMLKHAKAIRKRDPEGRKNYVFQCVWSAAVDLYHKQKRRSAYEIIMDWRNDRFLLKYENYSLTESDFDYLDEAFLCLNLRAKAAVKLKYEFGCEYKDIAVIMKISKRQVGVILYRARLKLRRKILELQKVNNKVNNNEKR